MYLDSPLMLCDLETPAAVTNGDLEGPLPPPRVFNPPDRGCGLSRDDDEAVMPCGDS